MIVAGFPGVGKTYAAERTGAADSDSSQFSWSEPGVTRHPRWPCNYIEHVRDLHDQGRTVFVSTHEEVRRELHVYGLRYTLAYPSPDLRVEYLDRFRERGSEEGFVHFIDVNWRKLVTSCWHEFGCDHLVLRPGEYLLDALPAQDREQAPRRLPMPTEFVTVRRDAADVLVRTLRNLDGVQMSPCLPPMTLASEVRDAIASVRNVLDARHVRQLGTYSTAKRLGLDQSTVAAMCRAGRLPGAWKATTGWRIPEDASPLAAGREANR